MICPNKYISFNEKEMSYSEHSEKNREEMKQFSRMNKTKTESKSSLNKQCLELE